MINPTFIAISNAVSRTEGVRSAWEPEDVAELESFNLLWDQMIDSTSEVEDGMWVMVMETPLPIPVDTVFAIIRTVW